MKTTTTTKTTRRPRKLNMSKYAIVRAWEIANNAAVAHNTSPINIALTGKVKAVEFFAESLKLAWKEAKAKQAREENIEMYKLHKVPKKTQSKILNALNTLYAAKAAVGEQPTREEAATEVFHARFSTPAARSRNRHILGAIQETIDLGFAPETVAETDIYAL